MRTTKLSGAVLAFCLLATPAFARDSVADGARQAGHGFKEMGIAIGRTAKEDGKAVGKAFREAGHATGKAFREMGREIKLEFQGKGK